MVNGFFVSSLFAMQQPYNVLQSDYNDFLEKQLQQERMVIAELQEQLVETINVIQLFQQKVAQDKKHMQQQAALIKFLQERERKQRALLPLHKAHSDVVPKGACLKDQMPKKKL